MLDSDAEQEQLIREFLHESAAGLDALDRELAVLDETPTNIEALSGIFRTFHTIHGTSGFFGFQKVTSVALAAERLSRALRSGGLEWNAGHSGALRACAVMLRRILSSIATAGVEGDADCGALIALLERVQRPDPDRRGE